MLGPLDAHRAVLPSQRPPSPPPHPHSHQPMPDYVHHDPVGPSPYEDVSNNNNTNGSNTSSRGDYLARVGGREPLQESTGNVQHHHPSHYPYGQRALPSLSAASSASCTPVLSHNLSAIPPPPILPTQTLGSTGVVVPSSSTASQQQDQQHHHPGGGNGVIGGGSAALAAAAAVAAASGTSALRLRRHQLRLQGQSRHSKNPIYLSPEFCQYRVKQKDKDEQKWPDILEDAFLDGNYSLLIPHPPSYSLLIPQYLFFPAHLTFSHHYHMGSYISQPSNVKQAKKERQKKKQKAKTVANPDRSHLHSPAPDSPHGPAQVPHARQAARAQHAHLRVHLDRVEAADAAPRRSRPAPVHHAGGQALPVQAAQEAAPRRRAVLGQGQARLVPRAQAGLEPHTGHQELFPVPPRM